MSSQLQVDHWKHKRSQNEKEILNDHLLEENDQPLSFTFHKIIEAGHTPLFRSVVVDKRLQHVFLLRWNDESIKRQIGPCYVLDSRNREFS